VYTRASPTAILARKNARQTKVRGQVGDLNGPRNGPRAEVGEEVRVGVRVRVRVRVPVGPVEFKFNGNMGLTRCYVIANGDHVSADCPQF